MTNHAQAEDAFRQFRRVFLWWGLLESLIAISNWNNGSLVAVAFRMWACGWLLTVVLFFVRGSLAMPLALSLVSVSTIGCGAQLARRIVFISAARDSPMGFMLGFVTEILFWLIPNLFMLFLCTEYFGWRMRTEVARNSSERGV